MNNKRNYKKMSNTTKNIYKWLRILIVYQVFIVFSTKLMYEYRKMNENVKLACVPMSRDSGVTAKTIPDKHMTFERKSHVGPI